MARPGLEPGTHDFRRAGVAELTKVTGCKAALSTCQTYLGHSSVATTLDTYGHLPGTEEEAPELLEAYLTADREHSEEAARAAGGLTGERIGEQLANSG
jgi:integrase